MMKKNIFKIMLLSLVAMNPLVSQSNYFDLSYCDDGSCTIQLDKFFSVIGQMSMDSLDNIYVGLTNEGSLNQELLKINPDGQIDESFGQEGRFAVPDHGVFQKDNYIYSMKTASDNSIINIYLSLIHI